MIPKGRLLIIGGAEDKGDDGDSGMAMKNQQFERFEILKKLLPAKTKEKIEFITTGSSVPDEVKKNYQKAFQKIGYPYIGFIPIKDKLEARSKKYLKRIEDAGVIFFSGGDQFRISTILGGTSVYDIIK